MDTSLIPPNLPRYMDESSHDRFDCLPASCLHSTLSLENEARSDVVTTITTSRYTNTGGRLLRSSNIFSQQYCTAGLERCHQATAFVGLCLKRLFHCCTFSEYESFNAWRSGIDLFNPETWVCVLRGLLRHAMFMAGIAWEKLLSISFWLCRTPLLCIKHCGWIVNRWREWPGGEWVIGRQACSFWERWRLMDGYCLICSVAARHEPGMFVIQLEEMAKHYSRARLHIFFAVIMLMKLDDEVKLTGKPRLMHKP